MCVQEGAIIGEKLASRDLGSAEKKGEELMINVRLHA